MEIYDFFCIGNISIDIIRTPSSEITFTGGAILNAVWVLHQLGNNVGVLTKSSRSDKFRIKEFPKFSGSENIKWINSEKTTSILNDYLTKDKERRICTILGQADPFHLEEIPDFQAKVIMYNGLVTGELNTKILKLLSKKGKLVVDAQGLTRKVLFSNNMELVPYENLKEIMPFVHFFKADAAEAEILTGISTSSRDGRIKAGQYLQKMGANEVLISHNTELLVVSDKKWITTSFKNRNLNGRTGRGDTCTAAYVSERLHKNMEEAALLSAALTSLKIETPGPFKQSRIEVEKFMRDFY
ncbi:PfkB family carbohydrate kinase [Promethearchaeum syntrophicum]|uniref:PfkB family carbohydrate kinase n=1 Tax=Promethearchaeum syntrophicum TaxID=2594042 RepID=A0A5B9DBK0_9ARCH|nr:PfkB family carbohydrate kinase [Candidatus Prometheoarchaeum syntrophicum]QEE16401.1 pfkB family carbohydrate kinase [Candidatus Prometheoarchaeum syntrophicum]